MYKKQSTKMPKRDVSQGIQPLSNTHGYGKNWKWDDRKYRVAELLADGYSKSDIARMEKMSLNAIKDWCRVPEFIDYANELIFETGMALKSERISKMKRMASEIERVFYVKAEALLADPSDERMKDISSEFRELLKQIATEKEEYVELQKTHHEISGTLDVSNQAVVEKVEKFLNSVSDDEKDAMKKEFAKVADQAIAELHD